MKRDERSDKQMRINIKFTYECSTREAYSAGQEATKTNHNMQFLANAYTALHRLFS